MRLAPLGLAFVGLLAAALPAAADLVGLDPSAQAVVEKNWPGSRELIEKRLTDHPEDLPVSVPALEAALRSAAAFAVDRDKNESIRRFRAALEELGPARPHFLGDSGGLGAIARAVLGDAEFLAQLDALKKRGLEPADDAALRAASARALDTFYKGRFEAARSDSDPNAFVSDGGRRRRVRTSTPPRGPTLEDVINPLAASAVEFPGPSLSLQLREAVLAALQAAARAVVVPASALASAVDRLAAPVQRDVKLIAASKAAVEWLSRSREPSAPGLLQDFLRAAGLPDAPRRAGLADALARTTKMMDGPSSGPEENGFRAALAASVSDYVRFLRDHLGDFPAGSRFSGAELGLAAPPGTASVEYEVAEDGRLDAARVVALDGSARERGAAAGTWTIEDAAGRAVGWSLDAAAFAAMPDGPARAEAASAAALWLTAQGFKPGGREMTAELTSLLRDALDRPEAGVKSLRIYADREKGLVSFDSEYEHGTKRRVARLEGSDGLALFERTGADPNGAPAPWRETMVYRGAGERELLTAKIVSNGESARRFALGTTVEAVPMAVHYARAADGRWERDGRTRLFGERRLVHSSAGVVGGAGEVLGAAGRGVTDLAGAAVAASLALDLLPERALERSATAAELQDDWFARARTDFADNAFLSSAGNYYAPGAYREFKNALRVDDSKYIQNVRKELTDQGHPLLGAFAAAGVDAADGVIPMAAGLGAINAVSPLGLAGQVAATGVNCFWTGQAAWSAGVSVKEFARARRAYDARDPASVEDYYTAVEGLANQAVSVPALAAGLHEAAQGRLAGGDDHRYENERAHGPDEVEAGRAAIEEIGRQPIDSHPELLSAPTLRKLYAYSMERRDLIAARVREISRACGFRNPPDVTSLIKGQEPLGTKPGTFEAFQEGVAEKVDRKGYSSLNRMTDMARGRVSLDDFDAVRKFTLRLVKTESVADVSYPHGTPPEFVAELKRLLGDAKVKEHKATNVNNARIHIDLLDPETNFVYELQVGTKYFNDLMQDPLVKVPQPLVPVFAKMDPHGISGDRANFHLVYYDGVKALIAKHPEIAILPETRHFVEQVGAASRDSGGVDGMKQVDVAMLTQSAEHLLDVLYQRDPKMFDDLGHGE